MRQFRYRSCEVTINKVEPNPMHGTKVTIELPNRDILEETYTNTRLGDCVANSKLMIDNYYSEIELMEGYLHHVRK